MFFDMNSYFKREKVFFKFLLLGDVTITLDNYGWIQSKVTLNILYTLNSLLHYVLKMLWEDSYNWIQIPIWDST